jgi:hypothetical protein
MDLKPTFSSPLLPSSSLFDASFSITNNGQFVGMYNLSFTCLINKLTNAYGGGMGDSSLAAGSMPALDPGDTDYYKCPIGQLGDTTQPTQPLMEFPPLPWVYGKIQIKVTYEVGIELFGHWFTWPKTATSGYFFFSKTDAGYEWNYGTPVN